jgi:hypothetical protein
LLDPTRSRANKLHSRNFRQDIDGHGLASNAKEWAGFREVGGRQATKRRPEFRQRSEDCAGVVRICLD